MAKKMTLLMPDDLHRKLKETSFKKGTTMAKIIIEAIEKSDDLSSSSENDAKRKIEHNITSVRQQDDGKRFLMKIPQGIAEKLGLTEDHHLYLSNRVYTATKKKFIKISARRSWSNRPEKNYVGFVRAEKDGTFLASIPAEDAEKVRLAHDGLKVRWKTYIPDAKLEFLDQEDMDSGK